MLQPGSKVPRVLPRCSAFLSNRGPPIPDEPFKVKPQRADFPIGKIGTSDAALDNFLDAVMAFDERERAKRDVSLPQRDPCSAVE